MRETARFAPPRRARGQLAQIERSLGAVDYAARDTGVLARNALRFLRGRDRPPPLHEAVAELADAVWELAAAYDDERRVEQVRRLALAPPRRPPGWPRTPATCGSRRSSRRSARSPSTSSARPTASAGVEDAPRTDELLT